jgi:hypothetical protein
MPRRTTIFVGSILVVTAIIASVWIYSETSSMMETQSGTSSIIEAQGNVDRIAEIKNQHIADRIETCIVTQQFAPDTCLLITMNSYNAYCKDQSLVGGIPSNCDDPKLKEYLLSHNVTD